MSNTHPGKQLYLCDGKIRQEVVPVCNSEESAFVKKPKRETGLWTSSWREKTRDSEWVEWCVGEDFGEPYKKSWWVLTPRSQLRLYVIESVGDLLVLLKEFPWETEAQRRLNAVNSTSHLDRYFAYIDFERLAQTYDGIWLTERGNDATHLSYPHGLNAWDVESVLWFRWCFSAVEQIAPPVPITEGTR